MPQLFTVKWPLFARLEAMVFFPVCVVLAGEVPLVQTAVNHGLVPTLAPLGLQLGIPRPAIEWVAAAIVVVVPYLAVMMATDRILTIRKGYALLSVLAIAVWAGAGMHLSYQMLDFMPDTVMDWLQDIDWLPLGQEVALAAGGLALLVHLQALWIGVLDQGDVAMHLVAAREASEYKNGPARDLYSRQTSDFRGWQRQEKLYGAGSGARETSSVVKILSAVTWIGVMVGGATAYHNWDTMAAYKRVSGPGAPDSSPVTVNGGAPRGGSMPLAPIAQAPATQMPSTQMMVPAAVSAPLPGVQRPNEMSSSMRAANALAGPDEAISERAGDGSFVFDAVLNGSHARMMFDTGATAVELRAEDASRAGINTSKLNYSTKVKTANGIAEVAPVVIETMTVGNITQRNVPGYVAKQGTLQANLLGQTFLARLAGYNVENNQLVLKGH
jgi:clan AA aspartic protease (TIGR02281 family)